MKSLPQIKINHFQCFNDPNEFDLLVLTSKEALKALLKSYPSIKTQTICVSKKTAQFAKEMGLTVLDHAKGYGRELFKLIQTKYKDKKLYFPHGKVLAYDMVTNLKQNEINFIDEVVYETLCNENHDKINFIDNDIFIFTSPSTVECFFKSYKWDKSFLAVAIGKTTFDALPQSCNRYLAEETTIEASIQKARSLNVN